MEDERCAHVVRQDDGTKIRFEKRRNREETEERVHSTTNEWVSTEDGPGSDKIELRKETKRRAHFFERATLFYLLYFCLSGGKRRLRPTKKLTKYLTCSNEKLNNHSNLYLLS
jgi:hypothetical protein